MLGWPTSRVSLTTRRPDHSGTKSETLICSTSLWDVEWGVIIPDGTGRYKSFEIGSGSYFIVRSAGGTVAWWGPPGATSATRRWLSIAWRYSRPSVVVRLPDGTAHRPWRSARSSGVQRGRASTHRSQKAYAALFAAVAVSPVFSSRNGWVTLEGT